MLEKLNPQQFEAATTEERTVLCLAAAGVGKTATLLARIEHLIRNKGVDPKRILALTFTNAAGFEMKERYKKLGLDMSKGTPEFRTFHSFCYSLIVKDQDVRKRLGYSKIPELCDENHFKELKELVKQQLGCKLSMAQLENDVTLSRKDQETKKLYKKALIKKLKEENVITFDMMCYNVCELFEKDEDCIKIYKQKYDYIHIDEFQDTDKQQLLFANSFPNTTNFWFCGDALQSIYQFRGCTNEYVKQLSISPGWRVIKLFENYRSTKQICDFANKFSKYASDEYRIEMRGQRDGDPVEVIYGSYTTYENPVCPNHLDILIKKLKENPVESAILCRTNKECACVRNALKEAGIEYSSSNKSTDTLNYLNSILSNEYMLGWLSSMLEAKEYGDYIRLSAIEQNPDIRWFLRTYGDHSKIKAAAEKIVKLRNVTSDKLLSYEDKYNKIVKELRIKTKCTFDLEAMNGNKALVETIRDRMEEKEENKVFCGTIHSSKGLEYNTVYLMGVDDYMFRLGTEEMNNLYYVGITRAKNHLTVFRV